MAEDRKYGLEGRRPSNIIRTQEHSGGNSLFAEQQAAIFMLHPSATPKVKKWQYWAVLALILIG